MGTVRPRSRWHRPRHLHSRVPIHRRIRQAHAALRYWLVVAVAALVLASLVGRSLEGAQQAERSWGRTRWVLVANRSIRAGGAVAGSVRRERWPTGLVPDAAIERVPPEGRATVAIDPGTPLTRSLVEGGASAESDRRTIAIALPEAHLPVRPGDRVDLWATADPADLTDQTAITRRIAVGAHVVDGAERWVVVAVDRRDVELVANASATAVITLVGSR